ncbi:unnamed protein product [Linum trigynum]|uniref:Uncharacterized protein n=1 Tax=Linum trigynum TaxID=586398 RepID=A0AAV2G285_9ROSI
MLLSPSQIPLSLDYLKPFPRQTTTTPWTDGLISMAYRALKKSYKAHRHYEVPIHIRVPESHQRRPTSASYLSRRFCFVDNNREQELLEEGRRRQSYEEAATGDREVRVQQPAAV